MTTTGSNSNATSTSTTSSSSASIFALLHPSSYLSRFLSSSLRDDGRSFPQFRSINLIISPLTIPLDQSSTSSSSTSSTPRGSSAMITSGATSLLVNVRPEIAKIQEGSPNPNKGSLIPNVELSPICSNKFKSGPPSSIAMALTEKLMTILDSSSYLSLSSLCISPGVAAWCLYLDVVVLSYDAGILDSAVLGSVAALRDVRLPKATFDSETGRIECSSDPEDSSPLDLSDLPFSSTFGIYDGKHLLSDPTSFEDSFLTSNLNLTLSSPSNPNSNSNSFPSSNSLNPISISLSGPLTSHYLPSSDSSQQDLKILNEESINDISISNNDQSSSLKRKSEGGKEKERIKLGYKDTMKIALGRSRRRWKELFGILLEAEEELRKKREEH